MNCILNKFAYFILQNCCIWRGGVTFTKIMRGCACRTSKIRLSLYHFFTSFPTLQYTIFEKNTQLWPNWMLFYNNLPKIHPIYLIWAPSSLMETPWSLYQILRKSAPKGRHIYVYHVNVRTPLGYLKGTYYAFTI